MSIILYSNICPCAIKSLQKVKQFASAHNVNFVKKRTSYNEANRSEANAIGEVQPFLYNDVNEKTISARGVTDEGLSWLIQ